MKKRQEIKQLEYEDAPSGFVTLYNYKEPFTKFEEGFGFCGILVYDGKSDEVQCHFCGEWFKFLPAHIIREHAMRAKEYKERVGLNKKTALIAEKLREALIKRGIEKRKLNLIPGKPKTTETREKISQTLSENRMEQRNLRGTCPEQLLERLRQETKKLGRTPTEDEFSAISTIRKTFGSFERSCRLAGVPYRKPGINLNPRKWTREKTISAIRDFIIRENKLPNTSDLKKNGLGGTILALDRYGWREILSEASHGDSNFRISSKSIHYTNEQLLNFLRNFSEVYGRMPAPSDCRRKLLPSISTYYDHFGSWKAAKKLALGHEEYVQKNHTA